MAAFNAPTREQCTVRRERTNTPIQALVLMNDPQFIESARHLVQKAIQLHTDPNDRSRWMLKTALSRPALDADVSDVLAIASEIQKTFEQKPDAAEQLINTGDSILGIDHARFTVKHRGLDERLTGVQELARPVAEILS